MQIAVCLSSIVLCVLAVRSSSPAARLAPIIGHDLAHDVAIHRLYSWDSFNDGTQTVGVLTATPDQVDSIRRLRTLTKTERSLIFHPFVSESDRGRTGTVFEDTRLRFYRSPTDQRIYFVYRNHEIRTRQTTMRPNGD